MPTQKEYWDEIEDAAKYFSDSRPSDEGGEGWRADGYEDLGDAINEHFDGHEFVIYTHNAKDVLNISPNEDAYSEQFGELPPGSTLTEIVPPMAMVAMIRDMYDHPEFDEFKYGED